MKDSTGLGLTALSASTLAVIMAGFGIAWGAAFFGGMGGFFTWGALEAKDEGD